MRALIDKKKETVPMHRIVQLFTEGKNFWNEGELSDDPSILQDIHDAELRGLILAPRFESPNTASGQYGIPLAALVPGLTSQGQAMVEGGPGGPAGAAGTGH